VEGGAVGSHSTLDPPPPTLASPNLPTPPTDMVSPHTRPESPRTSPFTERRRPGWREFRRSYPGILITMGIALAAFLAIDVWLVRKRVRYRNEIERLRAEMSTLERSRTDAILARDENRLRLALELIRRQARIDKDLHLSVTVDSGVMFLEREGAHLREMPIQIGPEKTVGVAPDTVRMVAPRGARTIEQILDENGSWEVPTWVYADRGLPPSAERTIKGALGPAAIVLSGGTVIYSMPSVGPLNDSSYVLPGAIRARVADLKAILPNLQNGMTVYFY
jgi:hypothetical protein